MQANLEAEKSAESTSRRNSQNEASPPTSVDKDGEDEEFMTGLKLYLIVMSLCLSVLLVGLDNAILATAVPTITKEFHSLQDIGWYGSGFLITLCAFQPTGGKVFQQFNLKWAFLLFLGIFELGSLLCGAANSSSMLIIGRAIAGIGASGIFSGALVIISHTMSPQLRPLFTGLIASMFGISGIVGPILGGALTQNVSWRWCFYINLPAGAVTVIILFFFFHPKSTTTSLPFIRKLQHLDIPGLLLFLPAIVMLLMAVQWGGNTYAWSSPRIIGLFCGFGVMIILFGFWEWHQQDEASIPPKIILQRTVLSAAIINLFSMGFLQVCMYYIPIWFQAIKGVGPTESGISMLPAVIANVLSSIIAGGLVTKLGYYTPFLYVGAACAAVAGGLLTTFEVDTLSPTYIGYQIVLGISAGMIIQTPLVAVMAVLPPSTVSLGTAVSVFFQFLGGAIFLAVAENIFATSLVQQLIVYAPEVDPSVVIQAGATGLRDFIGNESLQGVLIAYNGAVTRTFWIAMGTGAAAFVASFLMPWGNAKGKNLTAAGAA